MDKDERALDDPVSHHFDVRRDAVGKSSGLFRYVWPSELDLMAQLAGLDLRERWAGWGREPFTSDSRQHISVWTKPAFDGRNTRPAPNT